MYAECQKILNEEGDTIVALFKDAVDGYTESGYIIRLQL